MGDVAGLRQRGNARDGDMLGVADDGDFHRASVSAGWQRAEGLCGERCATSLAAGNLLS
jgi:hypothetical protein